MSHICTWYHCVPLLLRRYHYVGLLVLFLHDIGDVLLEFGKTVIYFKEMDGQKYPKIENIANGLFATFIFSW